MQASPDKTMTEKQISEVVEAAQRHFEVFYTKDRKIELLDADGTVHRFDKWEEVDQFIELLDASSDVSPSDTDMSDEEYDDALAEQFGETNEKE